jgi:monooxygenase
MEHTGERAVVPQPDRELSPRPLLDLAAGYVQRSIGAFPRQGDRAPWLVRQNYVLDSVRTLRTDLSRTLAPVRPRAAQGDADVTGDASEEMVEVGA